MCKEQVLYNVHDETRLLGLYTMRLTACVLDLANRLQGGIVELSARLKRYGSLQHRQRLRPSMQMIQHTIVVPK